MSMIILRLLTAAPRRLRYCAR